MKFTKVDNTDRALRLAKLAKIIATMGIVLTEEAGGIENLGYSERSGKAIITAPRLNVSIVAYEEGVRLQDDVGSFVDFSEKGDPVAFNVSGEPSYMILILMAKTMQRLA